MKRKFQILSAVGAFASITGIILAAYFNREQLSTLEVVLFFMFGAVLLASAFFFMMSERSQLRKEFEEKLTAHKKQLNCENDQLRNRVAEKVFIEVAARLPKERERILKAFVEKSENPLLITEFPTDGCSEDGTQCRSLPVIAINSHYRTEFDLDPTRIIKLRHFFTGIAKRMVPGTTAAAKEKRAQKYKELKSVISSLTGAALIRESKIRLPRRLSKGGDEECWIFELYVLRLDGPESYLFIEAKRMDATDSPFTEDQDFPIPEDQNVEYAA